MLMMFLLCSVIHHDQRLVAEPPNARINPPRANSLQSSPEQFIMKVMLSRVGLNELFGSASIPQRRGAIQSATPSHFP
jgi:hypothetical protein